MHYHYDILSWKKLSALCESILNKCDDSRLLKDKDVAYIYYHKAKAVYLFLQKCDDKEKIINLMDHIRNIELNYDYNLECRGRTPFIDQEIAEKKLIEPRFEVWLYTNSLIMYIISKSPKINADEDIKLPNKLDDKYGYIFDNYMILSYNLNLNTLLYIIGTKDFREDGLPPRQLWNSIIILYLSMIWNEISSGKGDFQYVIELYNSCSDIIKLYSSSIQICTFVNELEMVWQIINASLTEELASTLNLNARFEGFINLGDNYIDMPWANDTII